MAINVEKFADEVAAKIGAEEAQLVRDLQSKLDRRTAALRDLLTDRLRELSRAAAAGNHREFKTIDIVFDGPPSHEGPRFVEVERDGKSIRFGEWLQRDDGYWVLRIPDPGSC